MATKKTERELASSAADLVMGRLAAEFPGRGDLQAEALSHALILIIRRRRRDPAAREHLLSSIGGMWDEYAAERDGAAPRGKPS